MILGQGSYVIVGLFVLYWYAILTVDKFMDWSHWRAILFKRNKPGLYVYLMDVKIHFYPLRLSKMFEMFSYNGHIPGILDGCE